MNKNNKISILHSKKVFYSLAILICALGAFIENVIEDNCRIIANGILGFGVFYLIYLAFLSPKNTTNNLIELEDIEFPKDIRYLFFGFFLTMIMFRAAGLILDLVRYLIYGYTGQ